MNRTLPKIAIVVIALLVMAIVWINHSVNTGIKKVIEELGPKVTGTAVTVESVDFSILSGNGTVTNLVVTNPDGFKGEYAIKTKLAQINFNPTTLLSSPIVINRLTVDQTDIFHEKGDKGSNLDILLENVETIPSQYQSTGGPLVIVGEFSVKRAVLKVQGMPDKNLPPEIPIFDIGEAAGGITLIEARAQVLRHLIKTALGTLAK